MATAQKHPDAGQGMQGYDAAYPFKAPCEVVSYTPHSFSGSGIDSVGLLVRHAWDRRKPGAAVVRQGPGRVTPAAKEQGYTFFHTNLVGDQLGPLLSYISTNPDPDKDLVGRWVMLCGTPFMGTEDLSPIDGKRCNLLYVRDAHVFVVEKPD